MKQLQVVISELQLIVSVLNLSGSDPRIPALCEQARKDFTAALSVIGGQHNPGGLD
jgi:hypothetical protein